ncbi:lipase [Rhodococcus sp. 15-649-2-2]|uniref:lipase family protein n=1 Tax=Rhodococcus sp. 15-649-2-2 TaxID=2023140 RepID=UPI000B9A35A1|nr:lipase family protein [Rhodococcus sp. 15-649-2-2]OZE84080.1 lipase [Rhodococcus sp. 15-649-2-2]
MGKYAKFGCRYAAVVAAVSLVVSGGQWSAGADPLGDVQNPPRTAESIAATPLDDPWVVPPPGYETAAPGTVLRTRSVTVGPLVTPVTTTQLLVASTDAKDRPAAIVTSVIVPTAPWTSPGPRPVVAYNMAIDSLGATCEPSWTMQRGIAPELAPVQLLLARGYAVVVTDHQGPRHAYAVGPMAAHAVLDGLRGAVTTAAVGLDPTAPLGLTGYSGGAIASGWAVQEAPAYAPELNIVGAAFGGTPTDFALLRQSMNGNLASAVFLAAAMGVAREYPEMLSLYNDAGWRLAQASKDLCIVGIAPLGIVAPIRIESLSITPDAFNSPLALAVADQNRLGDGGTPTAPVFLYHGQQEFWIPKEGPEAVFDKWCSRGADVRLEEYLGEHSIVAGSGAPAAFAWLDDRLAGIPVRPGCSSFGR